MRISLIVARDKNRGIGYNNYLPWSIKEDIYFFREKTVGNKRNAIVMGRKTHESIGLILSERDNIVLTRSTNYTSPVLKLSTLSSKPQIKNTVESCLSLAPYYETMWIIGGSEIYNLFLPHVDDIYVNVVDDCFKCDTFFPMFEDDFILSDIKTQTVVERKSKKECKLEFKYYKRK